MTAVLLVGAAVGFVFGGFYGAAVGVVIAFVAVMILMEAW